MSPTLLILPASANTFVPLDFSVPIEENHSAPLVNMTGIFASVSTLLTLVGLPRYPDSAGKGGFIVGSPRFPSMECIRAVSSPQTNAPAPYRISMSKLKPVPRIFSPSSPYSLACPIAVLSLWMARGYSALIYTSPLADPIEYPQTAIASTME